MTASCQPIALAKEEYKLDFCNICGNPRDEFYAFFSDKPNRCKKCESLERHRIFKWAYDWHIGGEFSFNDKEILICTPGSAEMRYMFYGARRLVSFDIRPVPWFDMQMDISDMSPIPDSSFDCFVAMSVLQFTKNDAIAIDEIYRVLRPGGRFFAQATNIMNGSSVPCANVIQHYSEEEYIKYGVGNYRTYGDRDLIRLIGKRFLVKTFYGFDPVTGGTDFIVCGIKE